MAKNAFCTTVWVTYARTVKEGLEEYRQLAELGASQAAIDDFVVPCEEAFRNIIETELTSHMNNIHANNNNSDSIGSFNRSSSKGRDSDCGTGCGNNSTKLSVFCPIWKDPWMAVGSGKFGFLKINSGKQCT